ncbi:MAG: hypothetical protein JOZ02_23460 [Acidobacteria bacterium]|nr:hypothetical protein [Acidobacteriota bacterium]
MSDEEKDDSHGQDLPTAGDLLRWAEQTQRTINFMLEQQAQSQAKSETDMQNLREAQAKTEAVVQRLATATLQRFEKVEGEVTNLEHKMEALVDSHIRLADTHKEVEERLNAFIDTVERFISERRNGGGKREEGSG